MIYLTTSQRKIIVSIIAVLVIGLMVLVYRVHFATSPFIAIPITPTDPQTATGSASSPAKSRLLTIHIAGAVKHPGVYQIAQRIRVLAALKVAGGALPNANLDRVNLAKHIKDGQRILVPFHKITFAKKRPKLSRTLTSSSATSTNKIHLNRASATLLTKIPGIGTKTAALIINYRQKNGPYMSVQDLIEIKGIGPKTLQRIEKYLTL